MYIYLLKWLYSCPPKAESDVLKPGLVIDDPSLLYPASSVVEAAIRRVEDAQQQQNRFSGTSVQVLSYSLLYSASSIVEAAIRRVEDAQQQQNRFSGTSVQVLS
jgi:hypothetical protein